MMLTRLGRGLTAALSSRPLPPAAPVPATALALEGGEFLLAAEDGRLLNRE
jgi:hypothetical protein